MTVGLSDGEVVGPCLLEALKSRCNEHLSGLPALNQPHVPTVNFKRAAVDLAAALRTCVSWRPRAIDYFIKPTAVFLSKRTFPISPCSEANKSCCLYALVKRKTSATQDWLYSLRNFSKACPRVYLCSRYLWLPSQGRWRNVHISHIPLIFSHRTVVELEQISSTSIFTGWTHHAKACAGLPSSGRKLKAAAPRRSGRYGATRSYHA